jgi:hypothetical protein
MFASDGVAYREHVDPLVGPAAFQTRDTKFYADNPKQTTNWTTESIQIADPVNSRSKPVNTTSPASARTAIAKTRVAS